MSKDEALQLALETLEDIFGKNKVDVGAIKAIKEALETKDEPVAWEQFHEYMAGPNYVAPQSTWVGLTQAELIQCGVLPFGMSYELCQAIETKLKDKNGY